MRAGVQIAELEKAAASAPAEVRDELQKQVAELKQAQAAAIESADMTDMRAKYGDPLVEAARAVAPELAAQTKHLQAAN
jgi:hypothetical protein